MVQLTDMISRWLDYLYFSIISPFFLFLGKILELLIIVPLDYVQATPAFKTTVVALLTSVVSVCLRRLFKVTEKERKFKQVFTRKKQTQQHLNLIPDWKSRQALHRATDQDIDEEFNTYLAGRYVSYAAIYLLPVFLTLHWLGGILPKAPFVMPLPTNPWGIEGASVQLVFLTVYILALFCFFLIRRQFCFLSD